MAKGKSKSIHNKISKFCLFMVLFIDLSTANVENPP